MQIVGQTGKEERHRRPPLSQGLRRPGVTLALAPECKQTPADRREEPDLEHHPNYANRAMSFGRLIRARRLCHGMYPRNSHYRKRRRKEW
jgi:hypothetical protein